MQLVTSRLVNSLSLCAVSSCEARCPYHRRVVTATHDVVGHGGNAVAFLTGRDNIRDRRARSVTVGAHMVHFLWNEHVAEFAVGISVRRGNGPL